MKTNLIYSRKQKIKLIILAMALVIGGISLWYGVTLLKSLKKEEQKKIELWSKTIREKADLVKSTNELFENLSIEERKKIELWAKAVKAYNSLTNMSNVVLFDVIKDNTTIPVLLVDESNNFISCRNFETKDSILLSSDKDYMISQIKNREIFRKPIITQLYQNKRNYIYYKDSKLFTQLKSILNNMLDNFMSDVVTNYVSVPVIYTNNTQDEIIYFGNFDEVEMHDEEFRKGVLNDMLKNGEELEIDLGNNVKNYIFFKDSILLTRLKYYPVILILIMIGIGSYAYYVFSNARQAEQNLVWVGMAKETAHQLGTPLSSLMAWVELLKLKNIDESIIGDIEKDISRLNVVTDRFSKIGSQPKLKEHNILNTVKETVDYIKTRSSHKMIFEVLHEEEAYIAPFNKQLFEWVLENLLRNALDASDKDGKITVRVSEKKDFVRVDITDEGTGIPKSKHKSIFNPGYTTKKRGWGLGLSLAKRIIESYHKGRIFVKHSEIDKGTTFRISLCKELEG